MGHTNDHVIQHPPVLEGRESISGSDIHDHISHGKESFSPERFRKEIREVIHSPHERYNDRQVLHFLADVKVAPVDVLRARVVLRIVGQVTACHIIHTDERRRLFVANAQLTEESTQIPWPPSLPRWQR